jgi:hypothetical protein
VFQQTDATSRYVANSRKLGIRRQVCNSRKVSKIVSSKINVNIRNTSNSRDASDIRDTSNSRAPSIEKARGQRTKTSFGNSDDASNIIYGCQ